MRGTKNAHLALIHEHPGLGPQCTNSVQNVIYDLVFKLEIWVECVQDSLMSVPRAFLSCVTILLLHATKRRCLGNNLRWVCGQERDSTFRGPLMTEVLDCQA